MVKSRNYYNTLYRMLNIIAPTNVSDNEYLLTLYYLVNESKAIDIWENNEKLYTKYLDLIKEFSYLNCKQFNILSSNKIMGYDE